MLRMAGTNKCRAAANRLELLVRPGLKRVFDYLAYAISGLALVGGVTYGLQHLPQRRAASPGGRARRIGRPGARGRGCQRLPLRLKHSPPGSGRGPGCTGRHRSGGESACKLPGSRPGRAERREWRDGGAGGVCTRSGHLLRPAKKLLRSRRQQPERGVSRPASLGLQPLCAIRLRAGLECRRPARLWPGRAQQAPAAADSAAAAQPDFSDQSQAQSQAQFQAPPQVIILNQGFNGNRQGGGYRRQGQSGNSTQPPRQIGPNYPLLAPAKASRGISAASQRAAARQVAAWTIEIAETAYAAADGKPAAQMVAALLSK